jgi:16S rRNA (guanine966-N2)-methyltransferase
MSDKVRGALFNVLGDVEGLTFLDAFAGSGALAFEAVSRGAESVVAIDNDRSAQKVIADNIVSLKLTTQIKLIKAPTSAWLETNPHTTFDIVLCDPPYNNLQLNLLKRLAQRVEEEGLLVLSWPGSAEPPKLENMSKIEYRNYGDASLVFYRPAEE